MHLSTDHSHLIERGEHLTGGTVDSLENFYIYIGEA